MLSLLPFSVQERSEAYIPTCTLYMYKCTCTSSLKGLLSTVEKATLDREKEVGLFTLYKLSKSLAVHNIAPFKGIHVCT